MTHKIVQAASPPALANNARTGHPRFRNGKEEHGKMGHPPFPFYFGMSGAAQYAKWATKGTPGTTPTPPLSPANKPPPKFPEDFQSDWAKLLAAWMNEFPFFETIVVPMASPCILEPKLGCGPGAPPEL
jgi:hypothetical protein